VIEETAIDAETIAILEGLGYNTDNVGVTEYSYIFGDGTIIPKDYLEGLESSPKTRSIDEPNRNQWVYSNNGSIINGPVLEAGDVLYTGKSYYFEYKPTTSPPSHHPRDIFVEATLWIGKGNSTKQYVISDSQNPFGYNYTFTEPGTYTVKGNTMYEVYGSGTVGADNIVRYRYGEHHVEKTYTVVNPLSSLHMLGADYVNTNETTVYTVTSPPSGITFSGWTISPSSYTITGGTGSPTLTIKFNAQTMYTLKARYRLWDGSYHELSKSVLASVPSVSPPPDPIIHAEYNGRRLYNNSYVEYGQEIDLIVDNPGTGTGVVEYQWEFNDMTFAHGYSDHITAYVDYGYYEAQIRIKCIGRYGNGLGQYTEWSNTLSLRRAQLSPAARVENERTENDTTDPTK
jgi:hypothetical protein